MTYFAGIRIRPMNPFRLSGRERSFPEGTSAAQGDMQPLHANLPAARDKHGVRQRGQRRTSDLATKCDGSRR
jgi:hypothetical protein